MKPFALFGLLAATAAAQDEKVDLRWKFNKGDAFTLKFQMTLKAAQGGAEKVDAAIEAEYRCTVEELDAEKTASVLAKPVRAKVSGKGENGEGTLEFKDGKFVVKEWKSSRKQELDYDKLAAKWNEGRKFKLSPLGQFTSTSQKQVDMELNVEQPLELLFPPLPEKAVAVGEPWDSSKSDALVKQVVTKEKISRMEGAVASIETAAEFKDSESVKVAGKFIRSAKFDVTQGRYVSSSLDLFEEVDSKFVKMKLTVKGEAAIGK